MYVCTYTHHNWVGPPSIPTKPHLFHFSVSVPSMLKGEIFKRTSNGHDLQLVTTWVVNRVGFGTGFGSQHTPGTCWKLKQIVTSLKQRHESQFDQWQAKCCWTCVYTHLASLRLESRNNVHLHSWDVLPLIFCVSAIVTWISLPVLKLSNLPWVPCPLCYYIWAAK